MGWTQQPTIIQEDNQACVYASEAKHMTRNLRHLELVDNNRFKSIFSCDDNVVVIIIILFVSYL